MVSYSSQSKPPHIAHLLAFILRFNAKTIRGYDSQEASQIQGPIKAHGSVIKAVIGSPRILI
jgi:hypothetical protein